MKKARKLILYLSITIVTIIMLSLFYYSMRESLIDYFFENDQDQREKITSASSEQAQIMVDLANKQLARHKEDVEIEQGEIDNKSLLKELDGSQATVKESSAEKDENSSVNPVTMDSESPSAVKKNNQIQNGFVVVDCEKGGVIACPHYDVLSGTSPLFYHNEKSHFLIGRCRDLSIDVKTFCP